MDKTKDLEQNSKNDENENDEDRFGLSIQDKHGDESDMSNEFECKK
jgi:hypothetical protein